MVERARSDRSRRADILAAAEREFAGAGFAGGRIERIASKARVNKQLLFHYFGSKDGLYAAALQSLLARLEPPAAGAGTPGEELRELISTLHAAVMAAPGVLGLLAEGQVEAPAAGADQLRAWRDRQLARLRSAVSEGQRRGFFRDDVEPAAVAEAALAFAVGGGALALPATSAAALLAEHCAWR
jgi:TetR/AcrR family transcriptional regulator